MPDEINRSEVIDRLKKLADQFDKRLAAAFLEGVQKIKDVLDIDKIRHLLAMGNIREVLESVNDSLVDNSFSGFSKEISSAYIAGGELAAAVAPPLFQNGFELNVVFDPFNPGAAKAMKAYKFSLIREITEDVRRSIEFELYESVTTGVNPLEAARRIRDSIGLTEKQRQAVRNYRSALDAIGKEDSKQYLSNLMRRSLRDKRFDRSIISAFESGRTLSADQINKMTQRYTERYVKYRSEVVARTESIRALNLGNQQLWHDMIADGKVNANQIEKIWLTNFDGKERDEHRALGTKYGKPGKGVKFEEPFIGPNYGRIMYPGDPLAPAGNTIQCRCTVFMRIKANAN